MILAEIEEILGTTEDAIQVFKVVFVVILEFPVVS